MKCEVYRLLEGNMQLVGEFQLVGERIVAVPSSPFLEELLDTPIADKYDVVDSLGEPERFMKLLPTAYRGEPVTVSEKIEESEDNFEPGV